MIEKKRGKMKKIILFILVGIFIFNSLSLVSAAGFMNANLTKYYLHNESDSQFAAYKQLKLVTNDTGRISSEGLSVNSLGLYCWSQNWTSPNYTRIAKIDGQWNFSIYGNCTTTNSVDARFFAKIFKLNSTNRYDVPISVGAAQSATDICQSTSATPVVWNYTLAPSSLTNLSVGERIGIQICMNVTDTRSGTARMHWENGFLSNVIIPVAEYDSISPSINFTSPTETSGTTLTARNNLLINITATDSGSGLKNITIRLYNSTRVLINSSNSTTSPLYINFTSLANGIYYFNATAYDNVGNVNNTETRNITINIAVNTAPTINLSFPGNNTQFNNTQNISFNFTARDAENSTLSCGIYLDNALNQINSTTLNGTLTNFLINSISYGNHNWKINCTDGNLANVSETRYFVIADTIAPAINIINPANTTYNNRTQLVNISSNGNNIWFFNGTANVTYTTPMLVTFAEGSNTITAWANDTAGNINQTSVIFFTDSCVPNLTNTSWSNWNNETCSGTQMNQSRFFVQYDSNSCGEIANQTFYEYQLAGPNYLNTSWTGWANITCLADDTMNQTRNLTQFDIFECASNQTFFEFRKTESCNYCTPNLQNTTPSSWVNQGTCKTDDLQLQNRSRIEYDANNCGTSNVTHWDYQNISCNYCSYSIVNSSWTDWTNITCLGDNTMNQTRNKTEYDENYGSCYSITNLPSDLWNSGNNIIYFEFRNTEACMQNQNSTYVLSLSIMPSANVNVGTQTNVTGSNCPGELTCNLYREGSSVLNPNVQTLGAGTYNYTYNTTGNANYSSKSVSQILTVISNETYPIFSEYWDNSGITADSTAYFRVKVENTNGTVILNFDGVNYSTINQKNISDINLASGNDFGGSIQDMANCNDGDWNTYSSTWGQQDFYENFSAENVISANYTYKFSIDSWIPNPRVNLSYWNYTSENWQLLHSNDTAGTFIRTEILPNDAFSSSPTRIRIDMNSEGEASSSFFEGAVTLNTEKNSNVYNASINNVSSGNYDYYWIAYGNGTNNNINSSKNSLYYKYISLPDTTPPNILITNPLNTTYNYTNILVDISSDGNNVWYNWNNVNITYTTPLYVNFNNGINILYAYANDNFGNLNSTSITFFAYSNNDNDGIPDYADYLLYNQSNVLTSGLTLLDIKLNGTSNIDNEGWSGVNAMNFYDNNTLFVNFTHNFTINKIDLSKVSIEKTNLSLVVNLSGQLAPGEKKTIYINDNSFISLCIKDDDIASVSQISSGCNGANETDFTSCLGNSIGITINNITCYDQGSIIRIENLSYSGIKGTQASLPAVVGGGGCFHNWNCTEWNKCSQEGKQIRSCSNLGTCSDGYNPPQIEQNCIYLAPEKTLLTSEKALFDISLTIITPQITLGENPTAKISLINFGNKTNLDVTLNYTITDSNNNIILMEKEIVPVEIQNEFIKEFVLPSQITLGEYKLFVEINYEGQEKEAFSQGSFEILSEKQGFFPSLTGKVIWADSGKMNYWIIGALLLIIIIVIYLLIKSKYIRRLKEEKKFKKIHHISINNIKERKINQQLNFQKNKIQQKVQIQKSQMQTNQQFKKPLPIFKEPKGLFDKRTPKIPAEIEDEELDKEKEPQDDKRNVK